MKQNTTLPALNIINAFLISSFLLISCSKSDAPEFFEFNSARVKTPTVSDLTDKELLGKYIYFDARYSATEQFPSGNAMTQSCASCHLPNVGFSGAGKGSISFTGVPNFFASGIGEGAVKGEFGGRKPPSASYATFSPIFTLGTGEMTGEFLGGLFWDGRATGLELGNPAAEQARGPFLNPVEHNLPDKKTVLKILKASVYFPLWTKVWGVQLKDLILDNLTDESPEVISNYNNLAFSIAAYEASKDVNQFSSKYDLVLKRQAKFTTLEQEGYTLMGDKGAGCGAAGCHAEKNANGLALWTDFGYDNLGLPWKHIYRAKDGENLPDLYGKPDPGLFETIENSNFPPNWKENPLDHFGTFKTPTLRNVAFGEGNKRFMHNGIFSSLAEVVHFYNTRDVPGSGWSPSAHIEGKPGDDASARSRADWRPWGSPEYALTMAGGGGVGRIGLSLRQEQAIVAFLKTLNDTKAVSPPPPYSSSTSTSQ